MRKSESLVRNLSFFSGSDRDARILSLEPRVNYLASSFARRVSCVSVDELRSAGWAGAIRAVDRFDDGRGSTLAWFATPHIRGAIQDYLRSIDFLSRGDRWKQRERGEEMPVPLSIDAHKAAGERLRIIETLACDSAPTDFAQIEARHDVDALLRRAVLKPRTIEMLKRYYAGESYAELGRQYGVNESRAWQICNAGLAALRAAA